MRQNIIENVIRTNSSRPVIHRQISLHSKASDMYTQKDTINEHRWTTSPRFRISSHLLECERGPWNRPLWGRLELKDTYMCVIRCNHNPTYLLGVHSRDSWGNDNVRCTITICRLFSWCCIQNYSWNTSFVQMTSITLFLSRLTSRRYISPL